MPSSISSENTEKLSNLIKLAGIFIFCSICVGCATGSAAASHPTPTPTYAIKILPTFTPIMAPTATALPTGVVVIKSALVTYTGHGAAVVMARWSPDGRAIASAGDDGKIQLWDARTGANLWATVVAPYAFAVAWSPDGKSVAGGGSSGIVTILESATGKVQSTLTLPGGGFLQGIAWSPDGKLIAASSQQGLAVVWNAGTGQVVTQYAGQPLGINRLAWSPDSTRIATAGVDGTVQIWNARTGARELSYAGNGAPVWEVAWSPDGAHIASGTGGLGVNRPVLTGNTLKVWDAATGSTVLTYQGQPGEALAIAWSADGTRIASGGDDKSVQIWNASTGKLLAIFLGHSDHILSVAWSPDDAQVVSASQDGTAQVWQVGG